MKCKQCGTEYEGNFCPNCGAKAEVEAKTQQPIDTPAQPIMHSIPTAPAEKVKTKKPFYQKWWFIAIIAILVISMVGSFVGGGKGDKIKWEKMTLQNVIPKPPTSKGMLLQNSAEELSVQLDKVSDNQYDTYLSACKDKGFTGDAEETSYSYKAFNSEGYSLDLSHISDSLMITLNAPMKPDNISWPTSVVGKLLPTPKSLVGKFSYEYDDNFRVSISDTSKADFDAYVSACADKGFSVSYEKGDDYYRAENSDGHHISLKYEGNNTMSIEIDSPTEPEAAPSTESTEPSSTPETPEPSPAPETSAPAESTGDSGNLVDGMRPDFKEAMDSYEEFMNEYVVFMKKYADSDGTDLGILKDYAIYMSKYADMVDKYDKWESEDMNTAETAYYIDVQARVSKKLLEVAQ